jgi:hypothetical protein
MIYSGNYWWASSEYLSTLSLIETKDESNRMQAEMKLLENYTRGMHVNVGNEKWWSNLSTHRWLRTGLYSDRIHLKPFRRMHRCHILHPHTALGKFSRLGVIHANLHKSKCSFLCTFP